MRLPTFPETSRAKHVDTGPQRCVWIGAVLMATLAVSSAQAAGHCSATSPAHRVAVVELFTSEGCSSCPPADQWLSKTVQQLSSDQFLALSMHVDYWDYIGWKDPYAQKRFTERQYAFRNLGHTSAVYTPQVVLGGLEYRNWRSASQLEQTVRQINKDASPVQIVLTAQGLSETNNTLTVRADVLASLPLPSTGAQVYLAVFENKLSSHVNAGENSGVTLHHDRVVRQWLGPYAINGRWSEQWEVQIPAGWNRNQVGIAAIVQDTRTGVPLQATSLDAPINRCS